MGFDAMGLLGGWGMGFGMIVWIAIIALAVWALVALFSDRAVSWHESPLDALKRRYARGEISHAEFEQAKQHLG